MKPRRISSVTPRVIALVAFFSRLTGWLSYAPYIGVAAAYGVLIWAFQYSPANFALLALGVGSLIALVLVWQMIVLHENRRLYANVRQINDLLEERVRERTEELAQANLALQTKIAALQTLAQVNRELTLAREPQAVIELVCRHAAQLIGVPKVALVARATSTLPPLATSLGLCDPERGLAELAPYWQMILSRPELWNGQSVLTQAALPPGPDTLHQVNAAEKIQSAALARLGAEADGILAVLDTVPRTWSADDLQSLALLASQAAVGLRQAQLFESAQRRAQEAETLRHVGAVVASTLEQDKAIELILERLARLVSYDRATVQLMMGDYLEIVGERGWPERAAIINQRVSVPGDNPHTIVIRQASPYLVSDLKSAYPALHQLSLMADTRSWLGVPLIVHGGVIGMLALHSAQINYYHADHIRLVSAFADQVGVALFNTRLYEASKSRARRLTMLNEIGQAITSLDLDHVMMALMERVRRAADAEGCSVALIEAGSGDLVFRQAVGATPEIERALIGLRLRPGQGIAGWVAQRRQSALIADAPHDPRFFVWPAQPGSFGARDVACVPLVAHDAVVGVLELVNKRRGQFDQDAVDLLESVATQAAVALENARLFQETRRRLDEMEIISQVALSGASGLSFDEIVARATGAMGKLWPDAHLGFLFLDETGVLLRTHPSYHGLANEATDKSVSIEHGLTGLAARTRQAVCVGEVSADLRYLPDALGVRSEMVAPLVSGERVIGVVNVESHQLQAFSADDVRLLTTLAGQIVTILEKARLDAELTEYAARLEQRVQARTAELSSANEQLRQSERVYRALFERTNDAVFLLDLEGRHLAVNQCAADLLGYAADEMSGLSYTQVVAPGEQPDALDRRAALLAGETLPLYERVFRRKDGALIPVEINAALVRDDQGRPLHIQSVVRDITARKRVEDEMRRALQQEKELSELRSRFVSMASHEFRTPLNTILSSTELLEDYGARWPEDKRQSHLRRIKTAVNTMTGLLDDILLVSKSEAGKLEFKPAPLDLGRWCAELVEEFQLNARGQHAFAFTFTGSAPQVRLDERLLRQIFANLLSNAVKYSPAGGTIRFDVTCGTRAALFQVSDEGLGIPPQDQARVFETFHRAGNVGNISGTGLGLAIVKRSVERHGGEITFHSEPGRGTTFAVRLPYAEEEPDEHYPGH